MKAAAFNPKDYLIKFKGQDYLEVKYRLVWFRECFPHGSITTEAILLDWEKGVAIFKATASDGEGGIATGTGTETRKDFGDFVEKCETRAMGRALAVLGMGTQFVGDELSEGDHITDAPVKPRGKGAEAEHGTDPSIRRPTREELAVLSDQRKYYDQRQKGWASTHEGYTCTPSDEYIRELLDLEPGSKLTQRVLLGTMTIDQYTEAQQYFDGVVKLLMESEEDVPTHEPPETPQATPEASALPEEPATEDHAATEPADGSADAYATAAQIDAMFALARQVDAAAGKDEPNAYADVTEMYEHHPEGIVTDVYEIIMERLRKRLAQAKAAKVAS